MLKKEDNIFCKKQINAINIKFEKSIRLKENYNKKEIVKDIEEVIHELKTIQCKCDYSKLPSKHRRI